MSAVTHIVHDEIATTDSVSTYVVSDNVRLQDVEMLSAKNSPELVCAEALQDMTRLTIVGQQSGNEQQQSVTVGTGQQSVAVGTVQQSVAVGTVQQYVRVGTEQQSVAVGTDRLGTECTNKTNRTPDPLTEVKLNINSQLFNTEKTAHFTLVPDYGKSCKNVDYAVGGVTVARMQSWKFKPHEAQAGRGSGGGKEKTRKVVNRGAKKAVPVSTSAAGGGGCTGAPVNVKEALRAVLLSETRDFRTKGGCIHVFIEIILDVYTFIICLCCTHLFLSVMSMYINLQEFIAFRFYYFIFYYSSHRVKVQARVQGYFLKFEIGGGIESRQMFFGGGRGVNMPEKQIYIKKHLKNKKIQSSGGCRIPVAYPLGGLYPPTRGVITP